MKIEMTGAFANEDWEALLREAEMADLEREAEDEEESPAEQWEGMISRLWDEMP